MDCEVDMMGNTKIEWAEKTWNPVTGCSKISPGCQNCYAERMSKRLRGRCGYDADEPFRVTLHPKRLEEPLRWRKPSMIFVCSMGDLFHPGVPMNYVVEVVRKMQDASHHTFLVLTKRPGRMKKVFDACNHSEIIPNIWLGVTAENQEMADERIPILLQIPAAVRFVSVEPMLGPVEITKYLGGNNEAEVGTIGLPGCKDGRIRNRQRRASMEGCGQEVGSVEPKNPNHTLRPEESGKSNGQLLTSEGNGRLREGECFGAPFGMEAFQRPDSSGTNHQSQERKSERQFSGELGVSDVLGTNQTRCQGPGIPLQEGQYWKVFWVICGGETGPKARPMHPDWARSLRDQCQSAGVPFFFKQWGGFTEDTETPICRVCGCTDEEACEGGCWWVDDPEGGDLCSQCVGKPAPAVRPVIMNRVGKKAAGRLLDGREWNEMPEVR